MINTDELNKKVITAYWHNNNIIEEALDAMKQGEIVPYFQPKFNYATKQWCGSEALVRFIHPELGFLPLDSLIPIYEKTGQIVQMDLYMLECVCIYQQMWKELQLPVLQVSVNFSQRDFAEIDFTDRVMSILNRYEMTGSDIRFEITETSYVQCEDAIREFINRVHEKQFSVDMDDFGSGYSSLCMLDQTCVDCIKLDMNMTRKAGKDKRTDQILSAVTRLAKDLGIEVLAEGIETKVQADYLFEIGCAYMQGFYFSKPLPPAAYQKLLSDKENWQSIEYTNQQPLGIDRNLPNGLYKEYEKFKKYSKKKRNNSKTGITGVSVTPEGKYRADITFNGKRFFLGKFDSMDAAVAARKHAERMDEEFLNSYYLSHPNAKKQR